VRPLALAILLSGCAAFRESPPTSEPFRNTGYVLFMADPGRVNIECSDDGLLDGGGRKHWDTNFCGCVNHSTKTVWISRSPNCPRRVIEDHENCHIQTRDALDQAKAAQECEDRFPAPPPIDPWNHPWGR